MWFADVPLAGNGGVAVDRGDGDGDGDGKGFIDGEEANLVYGRPTKCAGGPSRRQHDLGWKTAGENIFGGVFVPVFFFRVFAKKNMRRKTRFSALQRQREIATRRALMH